MVRVESGQRSLGFFPFDVGDWSAAFQRLIGLQKNAALQLLKHGSKVSFLCAWKIIADSFGSDRSTKAWVIFQTLDRLPHSLNGKKIFLCFGSRFMGFCVDFHLLALEVCLIYRIIDSLLNPDDKLRRLRSVEFHAALHHFEQLLLPGAQGVELLTGLDID